MNLILRLLGIEKNTPYSVTCILYRDDTLPRWGHCHITTQGKFDLDAVEKQILIHYQKLGEVYTDVHIASICKL